MVCKYDNHAFNSTLIKQASRTFVCVHENVLIYLFNFRFDMHMLVVFSYPYQKIKSQHKNELIGN